MKVTIIGAGAIGGSTGAYLTQAGYDVTLVDKVSEHVTAMNDYGLRVSGCRGDHTFKVKAIHNDELRGPLELVILAVKAHFTEDAVRWLAPMLTRDSYVLSMQNGLNEEEIARMIGPERTVGCFIQFGADYLEPGHVLLAYDFPIWVGELDGKTTPRVQAIRDMLGTYMPTTVTDNIFGYLWAKLCLASFYFVGALTDIEGGRLQNDPEIRPILAAAIRETLQIGRASGVKVEQFPGFNPNLFGVSSEAELGPAYAQWETKKTFPTPDSPKPLKWMTGIQRDIIVRKRRTEADKQPGAVVAKAKAIGVPCPINERVVEMIHEIEDGKRQLSRYNILELKPLVKW